MGYPWAALERLRASDLNDALAPPRIATTEVVSDSSTFTTTETQVASVTAALVSGRNYRVRLVARFGTSAANDIVVVRVREDNLSGTTLQFELRPLPSTSSSGNTVGVLEGEYVAASTGDKTFVASGQRTSGSVLVRGTLQRIDPEAADFGEHFDPAPWAPGERDVWMAIEPFFITGRRLAGGERSWAFQPEAYL
jgi:hypothetical protein